MKNYKLEISYDGTRYSGWERKSDRETIQGKLESVLSVLNNAPVNVIGAGRTDAGVHAQAMTANVHLNTQMSPEDIKAYMNRYLPEDISVNKLTECSERFHSRYNAVGKTYRYTCYIGEEKPVFQRKYVHILDYKLDINDMKKAAEYLVGTHDFKAFCGNNKMKKSTVRTVDSINITEKKGFLILSFHGDGFLQNMVRIMTGTLLEVGAGRLEAEQVKVILDGQKRSEAGPIAPAKGLCLMKVDY